MTEAPWLPHALATARSFAAVTGRQGGANNRLYVILLRDPRRADPWGLYVGQTARDPDWRFDQHKAGYKASGAVRRFGERLMPEMVAHLPAMRRWEALELEAALAEALRLAGVPWVEGGH